MALRYQRQKLYSERSGVKTYESLDPLTGLPVFIYEFAGKPDPALSSLESENIPGVLETATEGGRGQVVVAYSKGYSPAAKPLPFASSLFVLESAEALSDAARAGIIHGDLRPERFLIGGDHVLVEGFGIPWVSGPSNYAPPEGIASYAGDVYAFGRVMQELAPDLPVPVKTLLDRCVTRKPEDRPSAAQLLTALTALQRPPLDQTASETPEPKPSESKPPESKPFAQFNPTQPVITQAVQSKVTAEHKVASEHKVAEQQTLEIDFTVSEPEAPQSLVMPPVKVGAMPDIPDLDLLPEPSNLLEPTNPGFSAKDFESDFNSDDFDMPAPRPLTRANLPQANSSQANFPQAKLPQDSWDDNEHDMLLETDPGSPNIPEPTKVTKSPLPSKTSSKLPDTGPKRPDSKIDPKQTFIKDLPPGATYKAGKSADTAPAPFKETPANPTFDEIFLKGNAPSKNTRRIVMVVALLLGALVLAGLAFFGTNGITGPATETTTTANYIVSVNLDPPNLPPLDLIVVASPEGSKFRAGSVVSKVPGQIVLDRAGTWQFQGRFQDKLSGVATLQAPAQYTLTITMPDLLPPVEGEEETPEGSEAVEPVAPDDANP